MYDIATASGNYNFSYTQAPGNMVPVNAASTGTAYLWQKSATPLFDGTVTTVATTASYNINTPLPQTTYYRRKITVSGISYTSNVIKINVVSQNWEDINYVREHDVLVSGQTDWKTIDQLPIGQKLQTTTYLDGLGRPIEKVSRGTAAPQDGGSQWGDQVQFSVYDSYGRQNMKYLPYTTTTDNPGKFKSDPVAAETSYYGNPNTYNETSAYSSVTFDNSPLNRVTNIKEPGTSWAAGPGNSADYSLNDATDNVQQFKIDYATGSLPVLVGAYPAYTLMKTTHTDENGKKVIEYTNSLGQLVLTKTELNDTHTNAYDGWICTYSVYDDFG
ncbi:MAG: DUF6443 domain-containing protein, partial [Cytophaga sp.]|uniref:DUF6443 domain-containing protein n=1 Tax=Cytophaga sp. TaxID=29535 RepID=UPI003F811C5F